MTKDQQAELLRRLAEDFGMWVVQIWEPEGTQRRPSSWCPFP